jgi:hypothetical protein
MHFAQQIQMAGNKSAGLQQRRRKTTVCAYGCILKSRRACKIHLYTERTMARDGMRSKRLCSGFIHLGMFYERFQTPFMTRSVFSLKCIHLISSHFYLSFAIYAHDFVHFCFSASRRVLCEF